MKIRIDGAVYRGRALDLRDRDVPATAVARSIVADADDDRFGAASDEVGVAVRCQPPGPGHETLCRLPGRTSVRGVLAAAARSRGRRSSVADRIEATVEALSDLTVPGVDAAAARRRLAEASGAEERLRERVATLRGKLEARRDLDAGSDAVESEFQEATAALAEAETDRIAAEQALARAEERARKAREIRDRRLALQDRLGNLRRRDRAELANAVYPQFQAALDAVPSGPDGGDVTAGEEPAAFEGDRTTATLAAVRIADLDAPVVLAPDPCRFETTTAAADCLDEPVVRCRPTPPPADF